MSGTKAGGALTKQKNLSLYGQDFYHRMGSEGGKKGTGHAFAHGRVDPHEAGRIGGQISKRGKAPKKTKRG